MTSENLNGENSVDSVHSVEKPLPNSKKVYISGTLHKDVRVPFREIALAPTKSINGEIEVNEPVRVYDTSGPWGDPDFHGNVTQGLPPLRAQWIRDRGDVEEYEGRKVQLIDDGFLSEKHALSRNGDSAFDIRHSPFAARKPLRARTQCTVTQLAYARRGIITPEMEVIAIRENGGQAASLPNQTTFATNIAAKISAQTSRAKSLLNSSGKKSRAAAPSSPQTSTTRSPSR